MNTKPNVPPQNLEAERAALGAMLLGTDLSREAIAKVATTLEVQDFYCTSNQKLYAAIRSLFERGERVDLITVTETLRKTGELEKAGGTSYIAGLVDEIPLATNIDEYARIISNKAIMRRLMEVGSGLFEKAKSGQHDPHELKELVVNELERIQNGAAPMGARQGFHPISVAELLSQAAEEIPWLWNGYLAKGRLTLLAGAPKAGKTTLTGHLVRAIVQEKTFLDRSTQQGRVLWLGVEEHGDDVARRFRELGVNEAVDVHTGPLWADHSVMRGITHHIKSQNIDIVVIDSLTRFWQVNDENDARQVAKGLVPLLELARETGVAIWAIHHARKGGGQNEDAFRGSTDVLAAVDIGVLLVRDGEGTRRLLNAFSRLPSTPSRWLAELKEGQYVCPGTPSEVAANELKVRVIETLRNSPGGMTRSQLRDELSCKGEALGKLLGDLVKEEVVIRTGAGKRDDPYNYSLPDTPDTPPVDSFPAPAPMVGNGNEKMPGGYANQRVMPFPAVGTEPKAGKETIGQDKAGTPDHIPGIGPRGKPGKGQCYCGEWTHLNYLNEHGYQAFFCLDHGRTAAGLPPMKEAARG